MVTGAQKTGRIMTRAALLLAVVIGRWAWWAPGPLRRWWERYGFRETDEIDPRPAPPRAGAV